MALVCRGPARTLGYPSDSVVQVVVVRLESPWLTKWAEPLHTYREAVILCLNSATSAKASRSRSSQCLTGQATTTTQCSLGRDDTGLAPPSLLSPLLAVQGLACSSLSLSWGHTSC